MKLCDRCSKPISGKMGEEPHASKACEQVSEYESSVLTVCENDESCAVCKFLSGDRTEAVLLGVIGVLDFKLSKQEKVSAKLVEAWSAKENARHEQRSDTARRVL